MALESATYIAQLNAANPPASDPAAQGADHLRLIKQVLLAQFPNLGNVAVTCTATQLNALFSEGAGVFEGITNTGTFTQNGASTFSGDASFASTMEVVGAVTFASSLAVTGVVTAAGATLGASGFTTTGNGSVSGNLSVGGTLAVPALSITSQASFPNTTIFGNGNITTAGIINAPVLTSTGALNVGGVSTLAGVNASGNLVVAGSASLNNSATVSGTLAVSGVASAAGITLGASGITNNGNLNSSGSAYFGGGVTMNSTLGVNGTAAMNGALNVIGQTVFYGSAYTASGVLLQVQGPFNATEGATVSGGNFTSRGISDTATSNQISITNSGVSFTQPPKFGLRAAVSVSGASTRASNNLNIGSGGYGGATWIFTFTTPLESANYVVLGNGGLYSITSQTTSGFNLNWTTGVTTANAEIGVFL